MSVGSRRSGRARDTARRRQSHRRPVGPTDPEQRVRVTPPADRNRTPASLGAVTTVTAASLELELDPLGAEARPLSDWLTTFPLLPVLLDPYTNESAAILHTARRILVTYAEAGCRTCWVVACGPDDARRFLGPYAREILTFADPDRRVPAALGIDTLPAFAFVLQNGSVTASAQGWNPPQWRDVADTVSEFTHWRRPVIGDEQDPAAFAGTPARP